MALVQCWFQVLVIGILFHPILSSIEKSELVALDTKIISAMIGSSVNILAKAAEGRTIQFCRWDATNNTKVGSNGITFVNEVDHIPSFSISTAALQTSDGKNRVVPGYEQYGSGLTKGECGITIQNVTEDDLTTWKYLLIEFSKAEGNPTAVTRDVKVEKAVRPSRPVILEKEFLENMLEVSGLSSSSQTGSDQKLDISCCSYNGFPNPHLQFIYDDKVITSVYQVNSESEQRQFCIHWDGAKFSKEDNGKNLKCTSEHMTTLNAGVDETDDSITVNFPYTPLLLTALTNPTNRTIRISLPQEDNRISLRYAANPEPTILWYRQGPSGNFVEIMTNDKEFEIVRRNPEPYIWESDLKFKTVKSLNSSQLFKVVATNNVGMTETFVDVLFRNINHPLPASSGALWYWLVAILIASVLFIVLGVAFILVARAKGWACWKRRTGKYITKNRNSVYDPVHSEDINAPDHRKV